MYLLLDNVKYDISGKLVIGGTSIHIPLGDIDFPKKPTGIIVVADDITWPGKDTPEPFEIYRTQTEDWLRCYISDEVLCLTNTPEPGPQDESLILLERIAQRIADSKTALADYLANNPLTWLDGKQYTVTSEKQTLLMSNIASYQIEVQFNPTAELTWNAEGEICTIWTFENLCALAVAISQYVKPLVAYQQKVEIAIQAAQTLEELEAIVVDYAEVYSGQDI